MILEAMGLRALLMAWNGHHQARHPLTVRGEPAPRGKKLASQDNPGWLPIGFSNYLLVSPSPAGVHGIRAMIARRAVAGASRANRARIFSTSFRLIQFAGDRRPCHRAGQVQQARDWCAAPRTICQSRKIDAAVRQAHPHGCSSTAWRRSFFTAATMSSAMSSPIVMFRNSASHASCPIMSRVKGNSAVRSTPLY
jgi:hypothetical protein